MTKTRLAAVLAVLGACSAAEARPQSRPENGPDRVAAASGATVYTRFCGTCHGKEARGDGPLAGDLRLPVPDLTTIAARNRGRFPSERVQSIINSGENLRGHGSPDMPAWGDAFRRTDGLDGATPEQAVRNLTHYLWSLQRPADK